MQHIYSSPEELETQIKALVGQKIGRVEYIEIDYDRDNPTPRYTTKFSRIHTVDFSVCLEMTSGRTFEITWDSSFYQYGIGIFQDRTGNFQAGRKWDVTDIAFWGNLLEVPIVDVRLVWEDTVVKGPGWFQRKVYTYPQDLLLILENGRNVIISASAFLNESDSMACGMMDNLLVTDDPQLADEVGIWQRARVY